MMTDDQLSSIEQRLETMQKQLDTIHEMVSVGKGALVAAKVIGWLTATVVALVEIWRTFHK